MWDASGSSDDNGADRDGLSTKGSVRPVIAPSASATVTDPSVTPTSGNSSEEH